jgi:hypothetical protein
MQFKLRYKTKIKTPLESFTTLRWLEADTERVKSWEFSGLGCLLLTCTRVYPKVSVLAAWSKNLYHHVQLYRYFVSQSSEFCLHNPLLCFSTSVCCCSSVMTLSGNFWIHRKFRLSTEALLIAGVLRLSTASEMQYKSISHLTKRSPYSLTTCFICLLLQEYLTR